MEEKIKEFLEVCQEVKSFISPRNKRELTLFEKYEQLLQELSNTAIFK